MKRVLLALALLGMMTLPAMAQEDPDAAVLSAGVLILHAPPGLAFSSDEPVGGWCDPALWTTTCETQVNTIPLYDEAAYTWYIISAFYAPTTFKAIEYGVDYTGAFSAPLASVLCTPSAALTIEYPATGSWPQDGSGIAIALQGEPYWTGQMMVTGLMAGYVYTSATPFTATLIPMPASNAWAWLSPASIEYEPAAVGVMGFGTPGAAVCPVIPELPQACCIDIYDCVVLMPADCEAQGGVVMDQATCDPNPCPIEPTLACCINIYDCVVLTERACLAQGGVVQTQPTCDPNPCPIRPQECCFGEDCVLLAPAECEFQGGVVYPGFTCAPNPCPHPMACCVGVDCVNVLSADECAGLGGVLYADENCDSFSCPLPAWACCIDFDETCYMYTEAECMAAGGVWNEGMDCANFTCPLWRVCCVGEVCHITNEAGCLELQGEWMPDEMSCDPNPCLITPNDPSSWGTIKSIYR